MDVKAQQKGQEVSKSEAVSQKGRGQRVRYPTGLGSNPASSLHAHYQFLCEVAIILHKFARQSNATMEHKVSRSAGPPVHGRSASAGGMLEFFPTELGSRLAPLAAPAGRRLGRARGRTRDCAAISPTPFSSFSLLRPHGQLSCDRFTRHGLLSSSRMLPRAPGRTASALLDLRGQGFEHRRRGLVAGRSPARGSSPPLLQRPRARPRLRLRPPLPPSFSV